MVKLYFLEWENGLVKAGFTYNGNGKRYSSPADGMASRRGIVVALVRFELRYNRL